MAHTVAYTHTHTLQTQTKWSARGAFRTPINTSKSTTSHRPGWACRAPRCLWRPMRSRTFLAPGLWIDMKQQQAKSKSTIKTNRNTKETNDSCQFLQQWKGIQSCIYHTDLPFAHEPPSIHARHQIFTQELRSLRVLTLHWRKNVRNNNPHKEYRFGRGQFKRTPQTSALVDMATFEMAHVLASPASPPSQVFVNHAHHSEEREANKFQDLSTEQGKHQKHTLRNDAWYVELETQIQSQAARIGQWVMTDAKL